MRADAVTGVVTGDMQRGSCRTQNSENREEIA